MDMLNKTYFHEVMRKTPTLPWINSAIEKEIRIAINWGAVGITMNPTHIPKAIKVEKEIWEPIIKEIKKKEPKINDDEVVDTINQHIVKRNAKMVYNIYKETKEICGYAAIQSNPILNDDFDILIEKSISYSRIAPNVIPKIPASPIGKHAIEELVSRGINIIATMGFSVSQAIHIAESYMKGIKGLRKKPKLFYVIIPGIFCDYLNELIINNKIDISPEIAGSAGLILTRRVYEIIKQRKYPIEVLVGGTRKTYDFTGFVGGEIHVTHSFDTWLQLMIENPVIESRISKEVSKEYIIELEYKLEDFKKAYRIEGLRENEFKSFGPCKKFNDACIKGYLEAKMEVEKICLK